MPAPVYVHQHQCTFNQTAQERPINCGLHLYCATNLSRAEVAVWRQRERRWAGCGDFWPTHTKHSTTHSSHTTQHTHHTQHTEQHTAHNTHHTAQHTPQNCTYNDHTQHNTENSAQHTRDTPNCNISQHIHTRLHIPCIFQHIHARTKTHARTHARTYARTHACR